MEEIKEPQRELDLGQAVVYLEKAIAEKGEGFIYNPTSENESPNGCVYFDNGQPSCIVGHVLSYMGYDDVIEGVNADEAIIDLGISLDAETAAFLNQVQDQQDSGVPWGQALNRARGFDA